MSRGALIAKWNLQLRELYDSADSDFARAIYFSLELSLKYRENKSPLSYETDAKDLKDALSILFTRARRGHAMIAEESSKNESAFIGLPNGDFDYAPTRIGQLFKLFDQVCIDIFALATRLAATPNQWDREVKQWL